MVAYALLSDADVDHCHSPAPDSLDVLPIVVDWNWIEVCLSDDVVLL